MPISPENKELGEKIVAGIKKASRKLLEERAANNDTVVISVNGVPANVPAKELLKASHK
jgi:hypothetical protein